jgi:hypothetical protein
MKLALPAIVLFLFPLPLTNSSPRLRRILSSPTKKPASLGWLLYLIFNLTRLTPLFLPVSPLSRTPRSLQLIIQTPSSL